VTRVAVDLLGGDRAPGAVVEGVRAALAADADLTVVAVGPLEVTAALRGEQRVECVLAADRVPMDEQHPVRAVRANRDASIRVTMTLVRDGAADAAVSAGPTGAAMAAAVFTVGLLPGVSRAPVAVTAPAAGGPVVVVDAGANVDCGADHLVQFALAGAAFATVQHRVERPRVGLLSIGSEPGKGDALRKQAYELLSASPLRFVGNVEPAAVVTGGVADVVVADGFTGNVLLKSIEATAAVAGMASWSADRGAGMLLGIAGVLAVGHGESGAAAVASCIATAAEAARGNLPGRIATAMGALVQQRRALAGLS
jgi:glycerol-3-phosphate acyltransferase PlsX